MVGILDHRVALAGDQAAKPFLAQYIGEPGEILAVDLQQVENKIGEALAARFQRCLQSGKIGLSLRTQPDNFAIKQRRIHINVRSGSNDFGKFLRPVRSEEHTSELQSLVRISYAVFCLKKKTKIY